VNTDLNTNTYDANNFEKSTATKSWNSAGTMITYGDSTYNYFHTVMGINEVSNVFNISIYPNPATDNLTIEAPPSTVIEITNIQGRLIKTFTATGNKTNISVSAFTSGVYILELRTEKGIKVKKFVKE
jgi:hypothetical protein